MADGFAPQLLDLGDGLCRVRTSAVGLRGVIQRVVAPMKRERSRAHGVGKLGETTYFVDSGLIGINVVDTNIEAIFRETNGYGFTSGSV